MVDLLERPGALAQRAPQRLHLVHCNANRQHSRDPRDHLPFFLREKALRYALLQIKTLPSILRRSLPRFRRWSTGQVPPLRNETKVFSGLNIIDACRSGLCIDKRSRQFRERLRARCGVAAPAAVLQADRMTQSVSSFSAAISEAER
jgi:hypothetical protein